MKLNKRRLMSGALALLMAVTPIMPYNVLNNGVIVSEAAEVYTDDKGVKWTYEVKNDGSCCIMNISSITGTTLNIPSSINGMSVTQIGNISSRIKSTSINTIVIPNSVTTLSENVFTDCTKITSITLSNNISKIPDYAFNGCSGLRKISIPTNVKTIGNYAFKNCTNLNEITFSENNLKTIGDYCFAGCSNLKSLSVPSSITSVGNFAFYNCSSLNTQIILTNATSIGNNAFNGCTNLPRVSLGDLITSIEDSTFKNCRSLAGISIPNSVTSIKDSAFYGCSNLSAVSFSENCYVTSIGNSVFNGCRALSQITIPNTVKYIGINAFKECINLTRITISNSVTSIEDSTFSGCSKLTQITIPNGVTSIGDFAFIGTSLKTITIPISVKTISSNAFYGCATLQSINVNSSNTYFVSEDGVLYKKSMKALIKVPEGKTGYYVLPSTVVSMNTESIANNSLSSITVEDGNTNFRISNSVFLTKIDDRKIYAVPKKADLSGLITIPTGIESIESNIFSNCSSLEKIKIPNSVITIEENAFKNCSDSLIIFCNKDSSAYTYASENGHIYGGILSDANLGISLSETEFSYDGTEKTPSIIIDDSSFTENDYELSYSNNINIGTGKVTITGKNSLMGTTTRTFTINTSEITDIILSNGSYIYDGTEKKPEVTVNCGDIVLTPNDYDIEYQNNILSGTATIIVTGKGNYSGTITKTFEITPQTITSIEIFDTEYIYDGTEKRPSVIVKFNDEILDNDQYIVEYSHNINVGKGVVTVTGKGNYTGTITKTFEITQGNSDLSANNFGTKTYGDDDFYLEINKSENFDICFVSNNKNVVTVDENGLVSIKGAGETTIIVSIDENVAANYEVNSIEVPIVIKKKGALLELDVEKDEILYNESIGIGTEYEGESELVYQSSDEDIATVDENGIVTATGNKIGDVRITVTSAESDNYNSTEKYIDLKVKGNMSFTKQPENLKVRLNNDATFSVETDGFVTNYQWYTSTNGLANGTLITGAKSATYTIPASQLAYDMNGIYLYCIASNGYDEDIVSNIVKLSIEEMPTIPKFSLDIQHENWITQTVQISLIGSTINNTSNDVAYKYSINGGISWIEYEDIITWNTDTKESTILAKAYNTLYPEIESDINAFVLRFDATSPIINEVDIENKNVSIIASDEISGVSSYGLSSVNSSSSVTSWSSSNNFEVKEDGQYFAFVKDNAGNISQSKAFSIVTENPSEEEETTSKKEETTSKEGETTSKEEEATSKEEESTSKEETTKPSTNVKNPSTNVTVNTVKGLKQKASYKTNTIILTWSKVANATNYEVYRATKSNGKYKKIGTTTKTSFTNKSLTAGTKYYYKVRAIKKLPTSTVYGKYSNVFKAQTKVKAPTIKKITKLKNKATLKFSKVKGANGYVVYVKVGKKFVKKATTNKPKVVVKGINKNSRYTFKVKAYSVIKGKKVYSVMSKAKTVK